MREGFYFPHYQDARRDIKLLRVRRDLGIEGYGIYFMLLEILREQPDLKYPFDDIELLAKEVDTTQAKVKAIITGYDLFQIERKEDGNVFFSPKQIYYLTPYIQKREQVKLANKKSQLSRKKHINLQIQQLSLLDATSRDIEVVKLSEQDSISQLEQNKQEQIKTNKTTTTTFDFCGGGCSEKDFVIFAKEKSQNKITPAAYAASLMKKLKNGDSSIIEEFTHWLEIQTNSKLKNQTNNCIEQYKGKFLSTIDGEKEIYGIEHDQQENNFKIYFQEGGYAVVSSLDLLPIK